MSEIKTLPVSVMEPPQEKGSTSVWDSFTSNAIFSRGAEAVEAFQEKRRELNLPPPGTFESLSKELDRDVLLTNYTFTGLRAEIAKQLSVANPLFQVSHSFSMGSQVMPPYAFAALYGTPKVFMQGTIDSDKSLSARWNYRWSSAFVSKFMAQISPANLGPSAMMIEGDYSGSDFHASIKANNPSILEGGLTGTVSGDYFQSVTPRLALGLNAVWQREAMNKGPDMMLTYAAKYRGDDWIGTTRFMPIIGLIQMSYWRRLADKIEAGVNLEMALVGSNPSAAMMGGPSGPDGQAVFGAKYDFRTSTFRAQVDSNGKLGCMLEKRLQAAPVTVTFVGQIDHVKNDAKVGLSVQIEAMNEDVQAQSERLMQSGEDIPNPPF